MKKALLFAVIAAITISLLGCSKTQMKESANAQFDYYVDCTTKEQIACLESEPFVESVFPFSLLTFERPGTSSQPRQIAYIATESFDSIGTSCFDRTEMVREDASILSNYGCNPIIISSSLARDEHLSIGDVMEQPCKLTEQPLKFTVGAIYNHDSLFAQYDAIILLNEDNNAVFLPVMEEACYTNAYIKASNVDALKYYLENEFVPGLLLQNSSGEKVVEMTREEIGFYYEDYQAHINRMK